MATHYYFLEDLQNYGQIMETGKNCTSLNKLHEELLSYISIDYPISPDDAYDYHSWEDWQNIQKMRLSELAEMWGFKIRWSSRKII